MSQDVERPAVALHDRLRAARQNAGLSQGQVAKLMGMHRPSVSEVEAGNRKVSADELARFAELYDVKAGWLLGENAGSVGTDDPRLQLAARELGKLKPNELDRLLGLIAAMRDEDA